MTKHALLIIFQPLFICLLIPIESWDDLDSGQPAQRDNQPTKQLPKYRAYPDFINLLLFGNISNQTTS